VHVSGSVIVSATETIAARWYLVCALDCLPHRFGIANISFDKVGLAPSRLSRRPVAAINTRTRSLRQPARAK
jgi:hypothetical protein